jgi:hypothetical protein
VAFIAKAKDALTASDIVNSSANFMVAILFRQEHFANLCYEIAASVPHALPVSIRRWLAKVFHYGGAHSGSETAPVLWFILYIAVSTRDYIHAPNKDEFATLAMPYILLTMLVFILTTAHPRFRVMFHDYFEAVYTFLGFPNRPVMDSRHVMLQCSRGFLQAYTPSSCQTSVSSALRPFASSSFGHNFIAATSTLKSFLIMLSASTSNTAPWKLLWSQFSTRPLLEWHAFATLPDEDQ